jgi:large subunit ribosomal protein L9
MQIILLERVENLGVIGDVVKVREGYARNFLLPQRKALRATEANKKVFEGRRAEIEQRNLEARGEAEAASKAIDGKTYTLIRQAGEAGQLYGSVSARDIADEATKGGSEVSPGSVVLDKPIKTIGVHQVRIRLHPEVSVNVSVNVARSADEAERQAKGENIVAASAAADRAQAEEQARELAAASITNDPSARAE